MTNYSSDYSTPVAMLISNSVMWTCPPYGERSYDLSVDEITKRITQPHECMVGVYGISLPLLRTGVPLDLIPVENACDTGFLDGYKVIFASYDSWLPEFKEHQDAIVEWVKKGGILAFIGGSRYSDIQGSWWKNMDIAEPQDALFKDLGVELESTQVQAPSNTLISSDDSHPLVGKLGKLQSLPGCEYLNLYDAPSAHGIYGIWGPEDLPVVFEQEVGKGLVFFAGVPTHFIAKSKVGAEIVQGIFEYLSDRANIQHQEGGLISARRGPYRMAYATQDAATIKGDFIDLLDANLPLIKQKNLDADQYAFLYEVKPLPAQVEVLYSSSIIKDVVQDPNKTSCQVTGTFTTVGVVTIYSPELNPRNVSAKDNATQENLLLGHSWNESRRTLTIKYNHPPEQRKVDILVEW